MFMPFFAALSSKNGLTQRLEHFAKYKENHRPPCQVSKLLTLSLLATAMIIPVSTLPHFAVLNEQLLLVRFDSRVGTGENIIPIDTCAP